MTLAHFRVSDALGATVLAAYRFFVLKFPHFVFLDSNNLSK